MRHAADILEFQFLIGRLVTAKDMRHAADILEFQFLIGRLVTLKLEKLMGFAYGFNSS